MIISLQTIIYVPVENLFLRLKCLITPSELRYKHNFILKYAQYIHTLSHTNAADTHTCELLAVPFRSIISSSFVFWSRDVTRFPDAVSALAPRLRFLRSQQEEKHREIS